MPDGLMTSIALSPASGLAVLGGQNRCHPAKLRKSLRIQAAVAELSKALVGALGHEVWR